jgi:hypothetical protein
MLDDGIQPKGEIQDKSVLSELEPTGRGNKDPVNSKVNKYFRAGGIEASDVDGEGLG